MSYFPEVIVVDDSESEDEAHNNTTSIKSERLSPSLQPSVTPQRAKTGATEIDQNTTALAPNENANVLLIPKLEKREIIEIDCTGDNDSPERIGETGMEEKEAVVIEETLDFQNMIDVIKKATEVPRAISRNKKGPICCNNWCDNPASVIPGEHIRDYYNIPTGKSFKLCNDCVQSYHRYAEQALKNLESNGNMLEGLCARENEFIILDPESDEEADVITDLLMEKRIGDAIIEGLEELNQEINFNDIFTRTKCQVIEQLENFVIQGEELAQKVSKIESELHESVEKFKNAFKNETTVTLPELDIPIDTDIKENGDDITVLDNTGLNEPSGLPPYGEILKPPPKVGDLVYAMKEERFSEWIPFKITDVIYDSDVHGNFIETFSLKTNTADNISLRRVVSGEHIAYSSVPTVRLGIGDRIIGAFNQNMGIRTPKAFISGMVAEFPTPVNRFRYLIFFDDGKAQYCPHEDLKLVYKPTKKIHEYFIGFHSNFVQQYMINFPERPMVKTNTEHPVRVELNGFWISGKVDRLDASLARITFFTDNHSEWIYRGSPRLRPVYDRLQANLRESACSSVPVKQLPVPTTTPQQQKPHSSVVEIVIDSSDDDDDDDNNSSHCVRAVARKSTSRQGQVPPAAASNSRLFERRFTKTCIVRRLPSIMPNPNPFHYHKCSRVCVTWVKYAEEKTKGANPLAIPAIFAFRREIDVTSAVTYTAPCGKRLRNIQEVLKYLSETLIPLTLDMFDFDIRTQIFDEYVVAPQFIIMDDISYGAERNAIACVNEVDSDCPDLMQYMIERRPLEGVNINLDPGFLVCCDCVDNCRDRSKCRCSRLTIDNYKPFNQGEGKRHVTKIGYQYQRLDQNLLSGIYECNSMCHCNKVTCINRVVQHQTRHKLQLFKTSKKGWGTRCLNDIPQGVFISTYVGNILTEPAANETGTINGDEYFAELDHIEIMAEHKADFEAQALKTSDDEEDEESEEEIVSREMSSSGRALRSTYGKRKRNSGNSKPSKPGARKDANGVEDPVLVNNSDDEEEEEDKDSLRKYYGPNETVYVMDAKIAGNIGRYFNHSCDPNIFVQNVYVDTHDLRFPWVSFFALRHIPAGTELTWDYGYKIGGVPGKVLYCHCGSRNCRKRLL